MRDGRPTHPNPQGSTGKTTTMPTNPRSRGHRDGLGAALQYHNRALLRKPEGEPGQRDQAKRRTGAYAQPIGALSGHSTKAKLAI